MGLSSKQVSSDGQDWDQSLLQANTSSRDTSPKQQQWLCPTKRQKTNQVQPSDPLNCPRCDSTNTKFCYYNNHNKSQPRYFCKTCKRHWTKGGTLRNVPVGGGRRKKRLIRTPANASLSTAITSPSATKTIDPNTAPTKSFSSSTITVHERERFDHGFTLPLVDPTSLFGEGGFSNNSNITLKTMNESSMFLDSTALFLPPDPTNAEPLRSPFRDSLTSFDSNTPCFMASAPFQPSTLYRYAGDYSSTTSALAESAVVTDVAGPDETSNFSGSTGRSDGPEQPWITTSTTNTTTVSSGNAVGIQTSNWGWDDIEKFASVDITIPWDDDVEINP